MKNVVVLGAIVGSLSVFPAKAETLLCVEQISGGLKFLDGEWRSTTFRLSNPQYVVSPKNGEPNTYEVKQLGKSYPDFTCERKVVDGQPSEQMACGGLGYGMLINFNALRFVEIYTFGYIEDDRSGGNTPFVTGGQCSAISP
ncbi:hypothetical protein HGP14_09460 [Rhizobium sp. P32RR-XVIII]|uniref:hypothetical protein n=1 Tax=Rhizobium sp. P32RR-XVIII TaxID=2726738 RepID=UPI0014565CF0|nr:hypothetical protein [Rhizobium sp. P32RR-XVIII]NLS03584.1 hypothetical protein [Rhizobium sp. P32RR-XVIII]